MASMDGFWPDLLALIHRSFAYMDDRIDPPSSLHRLRADTLAAKAETEICLLAHDRDEVLGCVFCKAGDTSLYIGKLAVDPSQQGRSIGRQLMEAAEQQARDLSLPALMLETRIELTENHATFAKMGFRKIGETCHPGYNRPTSITMQKDL